MVFLHAMEGIFIISLIVSLGFVLTKKGWFTQDVIAFIPKIINNIALPTFTICNIAASFSKEELSAIAYGIIVPIIATTANLLIGVVVSRLVNVPEGRRGIFRTVFFSSNAVFIGIPVNLALFGEASIPYALLYFLVNTVSFWTAGNYFISKDGALKDAKLFSASSVKNAFSPPLIGLLLAGLMLFVDVRLPEFVMSTFRYLGNMTTPLSLLFVGAIICGANIKDVRFSKDIVALLIGRFVFSPLLILAAAYFIPIPDLMRKVFVIQSALPAMTLVTIIAKVHEADAEYSAVLAAITVIFSVIAIPFYMMVV